MGFYRGTEKRYGVYMIAYRMWHGVINYNQKPRFASCDLDEVTEYAEKALEGSCNGTAYAIVDYANDTRLKIRVKEDNKIYTH